MFDSSPCAVPCKFRMHLRFKGAKWKTALECPKNVPVGTEVQKLLEICQTCEEKIKMDAKALKRIHKEIVEPEKTIVDGGIIYKSDAIKLLQFLPPESIDICIFDPAYESLEKHRKIGTTTRLSQSKGSSNEWFPIFPNENYFELFQQLYRVMKPGTFVFMFCDEETRDVVLHGRMPQNWFDYGWNSSPIQSSEFKFYKSLIWHKKAIGMGYTFRATYEFILFMEKQKIKNKKRQLNDHSTPDVLSVKRIFKGYPTEKPEPLIWKLITIASNEGDTVLDMFCGCGVVGKMAKMSKRNFILGDVKPNEAIKRLSDES